MLHLFGCGKPQIRHYVVGGAAANGCGDRPGGTGYNCGKCAAAGRGAVIRLAGMHQYVQASCNDVKSIWDSAVQAVVTVGCWHCMYLAFIWL